ncbi:endoglucanase ii [Colletotrichum asianum]
MTHRSEYRDNYPPHLHRHQSPTYSDYTSDRPDYSPTRDAGAVRVAQRHYDYPDRSGQIEVYETGGHRPREYYYDEKPSHSRPRSRDYEHDRGHRHHHHHHHSSRSKRRHSSAGPNWSQAAIAAASAGIIEAGLSRKDKDRTARVMTAAAGAGAIDAVAGKNNEKTHKSWEHIVGSTVGGLVVDRVAHGSGRR